MTASPEEVSGRKVPKRNVGAAEVGWLPEELAGVWPTLEGWELMAPDGNMELVVVGSLVMLE